MCDCGVCISILCIFDKTQNKLIPEQIQINTKHDTIFKALNIENTQNTNTYKILITHNNTTLKYQKMCIRDRLHS